MATRGNLEAFLTTVQEMGKRARHASNTYLIQLKNKTKHQSDVSCINDWNCDVAQCWNVSVFNSSYLSTHIDLLSLRPGYDPSWSSQLACPRYCAALDPMNVGRAHSVGAKKRPRWEEQTESLHYPTNPIKLMVVPKDRVSQSAKSVTHTFGTDRDLHRKGGGGEDGDNWPEPRLEWRRMRATCRVLGLIVVRALWTGIHCSRLLIWEGVGLMCLQQIASSCWWLNSTSSAVRVNHRVRHKRSGHVSVSKAQWKIHTHRPSSLIHSLTSSLTSNRHQHLHTQLNFYFDLK